MRGRLVVWAVGLLVLACQSVGLPPLPTPTGPTGTGPTALPPTGAPPTSAPTQPTDTAQPSAPPTTQPTAPAGGIDFLFPDQAGGTNGEFGQAAFGPDGVLHVAYSAKSGIGGAYPVRYGECAANCGQPANWQFLTVADHEAWGGFVRLALDQDGAPRLMWQSASGPEDTFRLFYAECAAGCTGGQAWRVLDLGPLPVNTGFASRPTARNLGVDAAGRVHLAASLNNQLLYATCASNCADPSASWQSGWIDGQTGSYLASAVAGDGSVHVAYAADPPSGAPGGATVLTYRTCSTDCTQSANWTAPTGLYFMSATTVDVAVDGAGHPRVVFNQGQPGVAAAAATDRLAFYAWCDSGCTTAASWQVSSIGLPAGAGEASLSLTLDGEGRPHVSANLSPSPYAVALVRCSEACHSVGARWVAYSLETGEELEARTRAPLPACLVQGSTPKPAKAFWYPGEQGFIALHPTEPHFAVVHTAYTLEQCGSTLEGEGVRIVRYAGGQLP